MIGAIIGDIIGSRFEFKNNRSKIFDLFSGGWRRCTFTDDTVMTGAIAEAYYGIPEDIKTKALSYLDHYLSKEISKISFYPPVVKREV